MINYKITAIMILLVFYAIYFIKMFLQRQKGIKTQQIGSRKELKIVETLMFIGTISIVIVQVLSIFMNHYHAPDCIRFIGMWSGIIGDMIFFVSVYTMKDSWRAGIPESNQTKLVTDGIYKYSRNPAFLGFDLMYIGILLMYFNIWTLGMSVFVMVMLHLQILQEEKYLINTFHDEYSEYKKKTCRYFGKIKK